MNRTTKPTTIRDRNRFKIIDAAITEFAAQGFKGATMARIAARADLPKPNVHYYFGNKLQLYREVMDHILALWDSSLDQLSDDADPADFFTDYISAKLDFSRNHPEASRIFTLEVLQQAPRLQQLFNDDYHSWFTERVALLQRWQACGKISDKLSPSHLLFMVWSGTQHYADYQYQVEAALGVKSLGDSDWDEARRTLLRLVLSAINPANSD